MHDLALTLSRGKMIEPAWFALDISRGCESYGLQVFMRQTVVLSDFAVYIPALLFFASLYKGAITDRYAILLVLLLQPSILLIDHGHFQYNSVMLGFLVAATYCILIGRIHLGAILYVACLGFKQMGLYYAPVVFAYLLSVTIKRPRRLASLGLTTVASFAFVFGPFYWADGSSGVMQVLLRIFPLQRGLFEDKVANFWCALNVAYKMRSHLSADTLQMIR